MHKSRGCVIVGAEGTGLSCLIAADLGGVFDPGRNIYFMDATRAKVAIVGGGCAGITAAFELSHPKHEGRYEVTVYQLGWRLGGKGASGRGPANRVEEHGLHLWMGFYENAFRLIRDCYKELAREPAQCRIVDWTDAFHPDPFCGVMDRAPDGRWLPWTVTFPATPGNPGDPDGIPRWSVLDYLKRTVSLVRTLFETIQASAQSASGASPASAGSVGASPAELLRVMTRLVTYGGLAGLSGLIQGLSVLDEIVRLLPMLPTEAILTFHGAITASARAQVASMTERDDSLRRLWEVVELVLATTRGIIAFRLVTDPRGFDAIDDYDCREWLRMNGASERAVDSAFIRALYDLAFAYENGDIHRPRIAAGQALRGAVRAFFTYRGAFFWKMQAGMGDVVFAPFYEVLVRRGVRFEFFHRLENVGLARVDEGSEERAHVDTLEFAVQAKIRGGKAYQPLVDIDGLPCWPSDPDFSQLKAGDQLKREGRQFESYWDRRFAETKTLRVGDDFDFVVLAVGVGALPHVCREILTHDPRWQKMVERVQSVSTQALQLWLSEDVATLGWRSPSVNLSGYVEPFDTWADMPQLIKEESFGGRAKAVAYFCSVLPDPDASVDIQDDGYPEKRRAEVRGNSIRFLERDLTVLWPHAAREGGGFRWDLLVGPKPSRRRETDQGAIDSQYYRANIDPTDRYSLSLPGTLKLRISPLDATYDNLTVAGDWTACGFMEGCVEAAVMSGRLAAHAISQLPRLEEIVGFDHP